MSPDFQNVICSLFGAKEASDRTSNQAANRASNRASDWASNRASNEDKTITRRAGAELAVILKTDVSSAYPFFVIQGRHVPEGFVLKTIEF